MFLNLLEHRKTGEEERGWLLVTDQHGYVIFFPSNLTSLSFGLPSRKGGYSCPPHSILVKIQ